MIFMPGLLVTEADNLVRIESLSRAPDGSHVVNGHRVDLPADFTVEQAADAMLSSRSNCRDDALDQHAVDDDWTSVMVSLMRTVQPDSRRAVSVRWDEFGAVVSMQPLIDKGHGFEFPEPVVDYLGWTNPQLEQAGPILLRALRHQWVSNLV